MHVRAALLASLVAVAGAGAQQATPPKPMVHTPGMVHVEGMTHPAAPAATEGGQSAFAAISEIVRILEADPATDWSHVDIEALRRHLIDMDAVTLRAHASASPVAGGLAIRITGDGTVAASIRRMVGTHAPMLQAAGPWKATVEQIPGGMRLTVVAASPADSATVARIRGLGFIGLMTQGAHHAEHHLMIARGAGGHAHDRP